MFNMLTTCYLFLGGAGAGALVVLSALECANVKRRFGIVPDRAAMVGFGQPARRIGAPSGLSQVDGGGSADRSPWRTTVVRVKNAFTLPDEAFARSWPLCAAAIGIGMLCLLVDLGRPDRLANLLFSPELSAVTGGAYALVVSLLCAALFAVISLLDVPRIAPVFVVVVALIGIVAGVVAMVYTGVLLLSLSSVLFWQTPLLPMTFVLSSLSCGIALVFLGMSFVETRHPFMRPLAWLARVDGVLVIAEFLCLVAYLAWAFSGSGTQAAAHALIAGDLRWLFWCGLVVGGLAVPFVLERFVTHGNYRTQLLWIAAFLLTGGFVLRFCVVGTAVYDVTQMPEVLYGLAMLG